MLSMLFDSKILMRFKAKTVLVTGAGCNTGLGIAAHFAAEGARVFVNDKTTDAVRSGVTQLRKKGFNNVFGVPGDIGVPADVESMFSRIRAKVKRLDVLVNNAASLGVGHSFQDTPLEFFEAVLRVNLLGTFHVSQLAARLMIATGGGAIVHIGSNVTTRALRARSAYVASKGGIDALALAMSLDLAPYKIRVNMVAPGYVHTDRWEKLTKEKLRRRRTNTPLGIESTPDDVAKAVLFLASNEADTITGTRLVVDGGCLAQYMPADVDV